MSTEQMGTYEKIYFALWELGQRYGNFVQFRVIGRSHDDRMIPMLEIGKGDTCIICLSGVESGDRNLPEYLLSIAKDYVIPNYMHAMIEKLYPEDMELFLRYATPKITIKK